MNQDQRIIALETNLKDSYFTYRFTLEDRSIHVARIPAGSVVNYYLLGHFDERGFNNIPWHIIRGLLYPYFVDPDRIHVLETEFKRFDEVEDALSGRISSSITVPKEFVVFSTPLLSKVFAVKRIKKDSRV